MDNGGIWPGDESYFQNIRETALQDTIEQLTKELAEARADIRLAKNIIQTHVERVAERDKLINQMREALVVADALVTNLIDVHVDKCASAYDFDRDIIKAALEAAERNKL